MTDPAPRLQFDLDADAIRLLHRSVAYYLERWPGGPDPREQQDLQALQRLLYAALPVSYTHLTLPTKASV